MRPTFTKVYGTQRDPRLEEIRLRCQAYLIMSCPNQLTPFEALRRKITLRKYLPEIAEINAVPNDSEYSCVMEVVTPETVLHSQYHTYELPGGAFFTQFQINDEIQGP